MTIKKIITVLLTCALLLPAAWTPVSAATQEPKPVAYADAVKRAYSKQGGIRDAERTLVEVKHNLSDAEKAFQTATSNFEDQEVLVELERVTVELTAQRDLLEMDVESMKAQREALLRDSLAKIAGFELDIWLLEETITLSEKELLKQEQLLQYGMTSEKSYNEAEQSVRQNKLDLEMRQIDLTNERQALNQIMGRPLNDNIRVEYEAVMEPRVKRLDMHVLTQCRKDQTYRRASAEVDLKRFDYATLYGGADEYTLEIQYKQAVRSRDDARRKIEAAVRTADANLEQLLKSREVLQMDLEIAENEYNTLVVKQAAGLVTQLDVDTQMHAIHNIQADLTRNQYRYWTARFAFDYPFLSA